MGKGGNSSTIAPGGQEKVFTWEEVRQHAKRDDKWIVIDGEVYDVTNWSRKHPGGSRIISHYAGQDASEAFKAFHVDLKYVEKYLKITRIGQLAVDEPIKDEEIKRDFIELRATAEEMGLFKPSILFYITMVSHVILFDVLAYVILSYFGPTWPAYLVSVMLLVTMQAQGGFVSHDFGHLSVFRSPRVNHIVHTGIMTLLKGASADWWNHMHNQHHAKPNVMDKDPDIRTEAVLVVGETIPKRVAKKKKNSVPYNLQHVYFPLLIAPLTFPLYFQFMVFRYPISRKNWLEVVLLIIFNIKNIVIYGPLLGVWGAIKFYLLSRVGESMWFMWVSQSNHIPMEIDEDKERPWVSLQLHGTCNVEKSFFNDWFTGHLNFQIEHHLFPTMPRHNLYKMAPLVKSLCEKHKIPYVVKPLGTAFADILRSLKHSGKIWSFYYEAYHMG